MPPPPRRVPMLLDTDIGTDVDDALALAWAALDGAVELRGVVTVNGDVGRRAAIARSVLRLSGRDDVPVAAGAALPLGGAPTRGMPAPVVASGPADPEEAAPPTAEAVYESALTGADAPVHVVAIGALTNVAAVLGARPDLLERVAAVHVMGSDLASTPGPEFNLDGDPLAWARVLALPVELRIVPVDVTRALVLDDGDRAVIGAAGPLGAALAGQMQEWVDHLLAAGSLEADALVRLHDPLAVAAVTVPSLITSERAGVALAPERSGGVLRRCAGGRSAEIVVAADAAGLRDRLLRSLGVPG